MSAMPVHVPRQRAVAAHRTVVRPVKPAPTAWGRTLLLMLLAAMAGFFVQQALVDPLGRLGSIVPGLALAGLIAWGGGR